MKCNGMEWNERRLENKGYDIIHFYVDKMMIMIPLCSTLHHHRQLYCSTDVNSFFEESRKQVLTRLGKVSANKFEDIYFFFGDNG